MKSYPSIQGAGIGLRTEHYQYILNNKPSIPWFEVLSDNYFGLGGQPIHVLEKIRQDYPVALHGVGMSIGSTDPLNLEYLTRLKKLADRIEPAHISDHLAWISVNGRYLNELMPLPYTEEVLNHLVERILQVQEFLGQRILIENPSPYVSFPQSTMSEWEFINEMTRKADCYLLLDVNNVYVAATNCGFNSFEYISKIDPTRVKEIHLAGYEDKKDYLFDTHGNPVHPPVWEIYQAAIQHCGNVPSLIEWDTDIPEFEVLMAEAAKAQAILDGIQVKKEDLVTVA